MNFRDIFDAKNKVWMCYDLQNEFHYYFSFKGVNVDNPHVEIKSSMQQLLL